MVKLFIVGFSRDMQEIELVERFSAYGQVNTVTIVTNKETGKSLGYGFLTMTDQAGADRAIVALNGATIGDRQISVRVAEDKAVPSPRKYSNAGNFPQNAPTYTKIEKPAELLKKKRPRRPHGL